MLHYSCILVLAFLTPSLEAFLTVLVRGTTGGEKFGVSRRRGTFPRGRPRQIEVGARREEIFLYLPMGGHGARSKKGQVKMRAGEGGRLMPVRLGGGDATLHEIDIEEDDDDDEGPSHNNDFLCPAAAAAAAASNQGEPLSDF